MLKHSHCPARNPSKTYKAWQNMKSRCLNEKARDYKYYGGRGITVCDAWMSFEAFLSDMGVSPDGYSLERIDNERGYSADNCRWIPIKSQAANRRPPVHKAGRVSEDAKRLGITASAFRYRIKRFGSYEAALAMGERTRKSGGKRK